MEIYEILKSHNNGSCIKLLHLETIDLSKLCGCELPVLSVGLESNKVQLFLDKARQLTMVLKNESEVRIFIGEQEVTGVAMEGKHLKADKPFYLHSGAVLWTHNNTVEFVCLRNGKADVKTVGI